MVTVLKDFSILLLVLLVTGVPVLADEVTERNNAILQFREAEPAKRGPASSERDPAAVVEGDGFTPEGLENQAISVPGVIVGPAPIPIVPLNSPHMSRIPPTRGNFSPIPRANMSLIPAPNQTIPDYPWPDYQPDRVDSQTEGTICTSCLYNQIRGKSLADQAYEIRRAVDTAQGGTPGGSEFARRLQEGALEAARRCRKMANFRGGGQSCKIYKNPEVHFRKSKGLCATGVQEAFKTAGKILGSGHGNGQDANLVKAGMVKAAGFDPARLPGGSVLTCNGPTKWGHIEIVVDTAQGKEYCSDFCSPRPICGRGKYRNPRAYTWGA